MNPTELITGQSLVIFGMLVVIGVFIFRRNILRSGGAGSREDAARSAEEIESAESGAQGLTEMLEVRLHTFASEVEGRMLTRIAVLDRLIVDADREIARLRELMAATNGLGAAAAQIAASANGRSTAVSHSGGPALRQPDATIPPPAEEIADRKEAA